MTKLEELEQKLNEVCEQYEDDCSKCPYYKECEEYATLANYEQ